MEEVLKLARESWAYFEKTNSRGEHAVLLTMNRDRALGLKDEEIGSIILIMLGYLQTQPESEEKDKVAKRVVSLINLLKEREVGDFFQKILEAEEGNPEGALYKILAKD